MNSLAQAPFKTPAPRTESLGRRMLNEVPEITVYFWVIKVLCTTVGETFADNLNENLGLGLSGTSYLMELGSGLLGSVATAVAQHGKRSVLIIHRDQ